MPLQDLALFLEHDVSEQILDKNTFVYLLEIVE